MVGEVMITVVYKSPPPNPVQRDPFLFLWQHVALNPAVGASSLSSTCGLLKMFLHLPNNLDQGRFQATDDKSQKWCIYSEAWSSSIT